MPKHSIYNEDDNSLPDVLLIHSDTTKPLIKHDIDTNCCTNGSFCWYLFCLCGLCDRY